MNSVARQVLTVDMERSIADSPHILSKVLLWLVAFLALMSVAATYYDTIVLRDFVIINDVEEENLEQE